MALTGEHSTPRYDFDADLIEQTAHAMLDREPITAARLRQVMVRYRWRAADMAALLDMSTREVADILFERAPVPQEHVAIKLAEFAQYTRDCTEFYAHEVSETGTVARYTSTARLRAARPHLHPLCTPAWWDHVAAAAVPVAVGGFDATVTLDPAPVQVAA